MPDVLVLGDADAGIYYEVDHIPKPGECVTVERIFERPGGKGANTAAVLSRLGTSTGLLSYIGDDHYGEVAVEGLKKQGVDISHIEVIKSKTNYCIVMLDPSGEKALIVVKASKNYPDTIYIKKHMHHYLSAKHIHAIGLNPGIIAGSLQTAHENGLSTSVDLDDAYQGLDACEILLDKATLVFINEQGARRLYPEREIKDIAMILKRYGPQFVVITRGKRGSMGFDGSSFVEEPAFALDIQDTSGAGDCFSAAFIHGYLSGWDWAYNLRFANAAAAMLSQVIGPQEGIPNEEEVRSFLSKNQAKDIPD
jgi:ribokinase